MSLIGCVDTISDTCIRGWAAEAGPLTKPVHVKIVVNSQAVATVACETFRQDLLAANIGDGCKAFSFDPSSYLRPGRNEIQVRHAATDSLVNGGCGIWVKRREGIADWQAAFLAAFEAYHQFTPEDHICAIGLSAAALGRMLAAAGIPFATCTGLKERADLVVSTWPEMSPRCIASLKRLVWDHLDPSGMLVAGFAETPQAPEQIRQAFEECGVSRVMLESIPDWPDAARRLFAFAERGRAEIQEGAGNPVLAHIHVPKCAGTSFRALLERYYGPKHLGLYVNDTNFVYGDEALRSYLLGGPEIRGFSSHHVRRFPRWLAGREMLYITFLRDPIEQFVSYMTHIQKHWGTITSESLLAAVPPDAPQLTLRQFAQWLLTQNRDVPFRENHNVNFFACHSAPAVDDRLAAAKAALAGFFFVGITERMEESMCRLRALARGAGLDFPPGPAPVENTSADYRDDLSWINPDDEVGSQLLRSVEKDRQLYDWAAARLDQITC